MNFIREENETMMPDKKKFSDRRVKKHIFIKIFFSIVLLYTIILVLSACRTINNSSVGRVRLNIETYLAGKDQPTHPAVIGFNEAWNGYRYWMVYTPYPEANGEEENPCITVSNDLYKWETPYGMVNPIADNEETGCNELKDGHILFRDDLNRIEIWYLGRVSENLGGDGHSLTLFRKYSYDGITWSPYEVMDTVQYLSPSIYWDGTKYQMWSIGFDTYETTGTFVYQESVDGVNWSTPEKCSIGDKQESLEIWHGAVSFDSEKEKYVFVYIPNANSSQTIEACISDDGVHFSENQTVIKNDRNTLWKRFYRPCLLIENGEYHLFYGVITEENKWYISYSKGKSLQTLEGISQADCSRMVELDSEVTNTKSIKYICRIMYHSFCESFRPETSILVIFLLCAYGGLKKLRCKSGKVLLLCITVIGCAGYTYILFCPIGFYAIFGVIGVSILEAICIFCVATMLFDFLIARKNMLRRR